MMLLNAGSSADMVLKRIASKSNGVAVLRSITWVTLRTIVAVKRPVEGKVELLRR